VVLDGYAGSWFIVGSSLVGYDGGQHVRDEERHVAAEAGPPPAGRGEQARKVPRGLVVIAALAIAGVVVVIVYGYLARPGWIGVSSKKFWDFLELLIVPAALALGVYWLNRRQDERNRESDAAREREREAAEEAQRKRELEVENQRAQDAALQAYLDQMGQLLLDQDRPLRHSKVDDEVRTLARARTLTVLRRLDGTRKADVVRFVFEVGLICKDRSVLDLRGADLSGANLLGAELFRANLSGASLTRAVLMNACLDEANLSEADFGAANLSEADLGGANLHKTYLSGAISETGVIGADLSSANLRGTNLSEANLVGADLSEATLIEADLGEADLSRVNLSRANLTAANLSGASLREVDLSWAYLSEADLSDANLDGANLNLAIEVSQDQLDQADSLESATMPNGQKYEDWLKSKDREEDGENE
jgi:uncharacterized protein YjbI with pentapeptide repeats